MGDFSWENFCSLEALAEIFDFVAGLVQRVPKKPNEMKADLQNSTASQGDCSWEVCYSLRLWKQDASATWDKLLNTKTKNSWFPKSFNIKILNFLFTY